MEQRSVATLQVFEGAERIRVTHIIKNSAAFVIFELGVSLVVSVELPFYF